MKRGWRTPAYESPSLPEIFGGTTTEFPRIYLNVEVRLSIDVLNLVDPWLQFSALKDGKGAAGRGRDHGW